MRSRCLCVRVAAPTDARVAEMLQATAAAEGLALPPALAARIAAGARRNLRRALLTLEACRSAQYPFAEEQAVALPDWETYVQVGWGWVGGWRCQQARGVHARGQDWGRGARAQARTHARTHAHRHARTHARSHTCVR